MWPRLQCQKDVAFCEPTLIPRQLGSDLIGRLGLVDRLMRAYGDDLLRWLEAPLKILVDDLGSVDDAGNGANN